LLVTDTAYKTGSIASELISQVVESAFANLKVAPIKVCSPDFPTPSSPSMTEDYYPSPGTIAESVLKLMDKDVSTNSYQKLMLKIQRKGMFDIPNREFKGPF